MQWQRSHGLAHFLSFIAASTLPWQLLKSLRSITTRVERQVLFLTALDSRTSINLISRDGEKIGVSSLTKLVNVTNNNKPMVLLIFHVFGNLFCLMGQCEYSQLFTSTIDHY